MLHRMLQYLCQPPPAWLLVHPPCNSLMEEYQPRDLSTLNDLMTATAGWPWGVPSSNLWYTRLLKIARECWWSYLNGIGRHQRSCITELLVILICGWFAFKVGHLCIIEYPECESRLDVFVADWKEPYLQQVTFLMSLGIWAIAPPHPHMMYTRDINNCQELTVNRSREGCRS